MLLVLVFAIFVVCGFSWFGWFAIMLVLSCAASGKHLEEQQEIRRLREIEIHRYDEDDSVPMYY